MREERSEIDSEVGEELDRWRIDRRWNIAAVRIGRSLTLIVQPPTLWQRRSSVRHRQRGSRLHGRAREWNAPARHGRPSRLPTSKSSDRQCDRLAPVSPSEAATSPSRFHVPSPTLTVVISPHAARHPHTGSRLSDYQVAATLCRPRPQGGGSQTRGRLPFPWRGPQSTRRWSRWDCPWRCCSRARQ